IAVPNLANVHDRHVHRPENREENGIGVASENNKRQTETEPCKDQQSVVGDSEPKSVGIRSILAMSEPSCVWIEARKRFAGVRPCSPINGRSCCAAMRNATA